MNLKRLKPILYLITPGATSDRTDSGSSEFHTLAQQISAAVAAGIQLIQIREKRLSGRVLFELTQRAVEIAHGSKTSVLVNDRADVAAAAGAAGVHLTTRSINAAVIRKSFGSEFVIGVSTHSMDEARRARDAGADFAVLGPVFQTASKENYGKPLGLDRFSEVARELAPFPLLALGGVSVEKINLCLDTGAAGIAGINLFTETEKLDAIVSQANAAAKGVSQ